MNQSERRRFLIDWLCAEEPRYARLPVPADAQGQRDLLRSLMNVRAPRGIDADVLAVQDAYLREEIAQRGVTRVEDLQPVREGIYLWQGDITTLAADAIVNAANSALLGCFQPLHSCIDNCIHSYAGMQLRLKCAELMRAQGHDEPTGQAKLTPAYNLPSKYVLHTVGPIVEGRLTEAHCAQLASCYRACLQLAAAHGCESIAFCSISTGVFGFPKEAAAEIAIRTVEDWKAETGSPMRVIFNVFSDSSLALYRRKLAV